MPELPEVEVTRLGLQPALTGSRTTALRLGKPLRWPLGCAGDALAGQCIEQVRRRGKYLLLETASGRLIVHLGMSGSLRWVERDAPPPGPHEHFILLTDRGELRLLDPRRFGAVVWQPAEAPPHRLLSALGPEPLEPGFDGAMLHASLRGRHAPIKPLLLDQRVVAGVGNIYACEALFHAGIDPRAPGGSLSRPRCTRLAGAIRAVLAAAVAAGGSSLRNYVGADGQPGHFQLATRVYGREGLPCHHCGRPVSRITQGQRSTFFCRTCQKR